MTNSKHGGQGYSSGTSKNTDDSYRSSRDSGGGYSKRRSRPEPGEQDYEDHASYGDNDSYDRQKSSRSAGKRGSQGYDDDRGRNGDDERERRSDRYGDAGRESTRYSDDDSSRGYGGKQQGRAGYGNRNGGDEGGYGDELPEKRPSQGGYSSSDKDRDRSSNGGRSHRARDNDRDSSYGDADYDRDHRDASPDREPERTYDQSNNDRYADNDQDADERRDGDRQPSGGGDFFRVWSWPTPTMQYNGRRIESGVSEIEDLGLTDAVLHVNSHSNAKEAGRFRFVQGNNRDRTIRGLTDATDAIRNVGADAHLMVFPSPTLAYTQQMVDGVLEVLDAAQPRSVLLDAEDNWRRRGVSSQRSQSVDEIRRRLLPELHERNIALGFTDFMLNDAGRMLAEICDYVLPQAYSTTASGRREPGEMQERLHRTYASLDKPIVPALAAWKLRRRRGRPQESVYDTMRYTLESVMQLSNPSCREVAYWSLPAAKSRNHNSRQETRDILRFLRDISQEARQRESFHAGAIIR